MADQRHVNLPQGLGGLSHNPGVFIKLVDIQQAHGHLFGTSHPQVTGHGLQGFEIPGNQVQPASLSGIDPGTGLGNGRGRADNQDSRGAVIVSLQVGQLLLRTKPESSGLP